MQTQGSTTSTQDALRLAVILARKTVVGAGWSEPKPGDLVVEVTQLHDDADAIGYLVGHDDAPCHADDPLDGSVPMREVWDIRPLNPNAALQDIGGEMVQRWENAQFVALPQQVVGRWKRDLSGTGREQGT